MAREELEQPGWPILLIDGGREHAALIQRQFDAGGLIANIHFVEDGEEAVAFLLQTEPYTRAPRPALIFLNLELRDGGFEMLTMAKNDCTLARIPIIVSSLSGDGEIEKAYSLHANCCVREPRSPEELVSFVEFIQKFWLEITTLPN